MRRYRLIWLLGIVGVVAGSVSTTMPAQSHTVYRHGIMVSSTQTVPNIGDYLGAGLHALWLGLMFALLGVVITVILRFRRQSA